MAASDASDRVQCHQTAVYRTLPKGASKRVVGPCESNASTSSSVVGRRTPLSGYVITIATDKKKRIHLYGAFTLYHLFMAQYRHYLFCSCSVFCRDPVLFCFFRSNNAVGKLSY